MKPIELNPIEHCLLGKCRTVIEAQEALALIAKAHTTPTITPTTPKIQQPKTPRTGRPSIISRMPKKLLKQLIHDYKHNYNKSSAEIAKEYGISDKTLWTHLGKRGIYATHKPHKVKRHRIKGKRITTQNEVMEAIVRHFHSNESFTTKSLAQELNTTKGRIYAHIHALRGINWKTLRWFDVEGKGTSQKTYVPPTFNPQE